MKTGISKLMHKKPAVLTAGRMRASYYPDGIPLLSWPLNRTLSGRNDGYPTISRAERALVEFSRWLFRVEPVAA